MSKTKKYLMLTSAILLLLWGAASAVFALKYITDVSKLNLITTEVVKLFSEITYESARNAARFIVAFFASSAIVSLAFSGFIFRYTFYSPAEYEEKRSIAVTMAVLAFVVVNPVIAALFLVATLMKDKNYVPPVPVLAVDALEEKLKKLLVLKEKNLISEEEYNKLRGEILSSEAK